MKKIQFKNLICILTAIFLLLSCFVLPACDLFKKDDGEDIKAEENDGKRTFGFSEYVGTITNPGVGYTSTDWYYTAPNNTVMHDKQGAVVLFFIDIGPFSGGINESGKDYDLDSTFFSALRATFENCRNNGSTIALRFRYDSNGKSNPEPNSFEQVLKHISQIKQNGILEDYKDILMFVESGFVGQWGEQHGGKYTTVDYKAEVLKAMLDCVPSPIPVTVRTPDIFAKYVGIKRNELADYKVQPGSDAARVGLYDDGYMGSNSDLGTYSNREIETEWLGNQTFTSYFGGEFSGNIDFAKKYDTYLPENCIPEMYKTHLSYINGNIFQLYKDYKFQKKYDVEGYDNSAYYGSTVYQFIRDHLGYRFVLKNSVFPETVSQCGNLKFSFELVNNGFANPIKEQKCEVILEKDGNFITTEVDLDPTKWYSGKTVKTELNIKLPFIAGEGKWNVYFKSSISVNSLSQYSFRSIRFANNSVWQPALGANYLGYIEIKPANKNTEDNTFGEVGKTLSTAHLYNLGSVPTVDGLATEGEWTDADIVADDGTYKLYAKCDEDNLYIMANIPHKAKSPVFNFKAKDMNNKSYWLYQQSNGAVYFNHEGETGHKGLMLKYSDDLFEFKIPLYMLGLQKGSVLKEMSVNIQDSGNEWKSTGNIATTAEYTVTPEIIVHNATEHIYVKKGGGYNVTLSANVKITNIEWYLNGSLLKNEKSPAIKLTNITSDSTLSVKITSVGGTVKEVDVADIKVIS